MKSVDIAVWAASRGWTVVKVKPGTKRPLGPWRDQGYRDPSELRRVWNGEWAVGILTGPSNLVCDDLDVDKQTGDPAGEWALEELADGRELPRTFTVATPSGGTHLVWQSTNGRSYKTCGGQVGDHIDVRGRGGHFVLWDPSLPTRIVTDDRDPVPIPDWLSDLHPEADSVPGGDVMISIPNTAAWVNEHGNGEPCVVIQETFDKFTSKFADGVPHDAMIGAVYALVGDSVAGHRGLKAALSQLQDIYRAAMKGKSREREWAEEWHNAVNGAISKKLGRVGGHVPDDDPCVLDDEDFIITPLNRHGKLIQRLSDRTAKMVSWAWQGHMARASITMLDGDTQTGKTLVLYDVAARLSRGLPMPDDTHAINRPSPILVLAPEESIDTIIVPRLAAAGADLDMVYIPRIRVKRGRAPEMFLLPDASNKIISMIEEAKAVLTIIDPIPAFLHPTINSGVDSSVRSALSPLSLALGDSDCSVAMVRHFNKNTGMSAKFRGGGSVAFGAIARVSLVAARLPMSAAGPAQFGLSISGTNMTVGHDKTLTYSIVDSGIQMDDIGNMVPRIEWHEVIDMDADTLIKGDGARRGPEPEVQNQIIEVLEELFDQKDTWDAAEIPKELDNANVSSDPKTLAKARERLGIRTERVYKPGGSLEKWVWTTRKSSITPASKNGKK